MDILYLFGYYINHRLLMLQGGSCLDKETYNFNFTGTPNHRSCDHVPKSESWECSTPAGSSSRLLDCLNRLLPNESAA